MPWARSSGGVKLAHEVVKQWQNTSPSSLYTEYKKMPPVFHVDPYESCGGLYCSVEAALVADSDSPLMDLITEYSSFTLAHYNHSLLRYNLCVPASCRPFHDNSSSELVQSLEACLNSSLQQRYGLKSRLAEQGVHCWRTDKPRALEPADWATVAVLLVLLAVNTLGTLYDFFWIDGKDAGIRFLTCFSLRRNWKKLVIPSVADPDRRLPCLKCLSAFKVISMALVVIAHSSNASIFFVDNPQFNEDVNKDFGTKLVKSATIVVQTFFLISGFLLTYNLELMKEKYNFQINWKLIPKYTIKRWLRLIPPYALLLFYTLTLNKHLITGPHWHILALEEQEACRRSWWQHLLYINNYNDESRCLLHTWYLAADIQLLMLGLIIYVTCRSAGSRKLVLPLLMMVAVLLPVAHTYWQDLDGILVSSPEAILKFYLHDPTFTHVYKRGHTNMFSYLAGMSTGLLAYHAQKVKYDLQKYRKYLFLFYFMFPVVAAAIACGSILFVEGPRASLGLRMFFAGYQKPIWSLFIIIIIWSNIFRYEAMVRGAMEWRGWDIASKLCYSVYLVHMAVINYVISLNVYNHVTYTSMLLNLCYISIATCVLSLGIWLLVEQPMRQAQAYWFYRPNCPRRQTDVVKTIVPRKEKKTKEGVKTSGCSK